MLIMASNVSFSQQFSKDVTEFISHNSPVTAITQVILIDGTGKVVQKNQDVVIEKGKIIDIGNHGMVKIPNNALVINGLGKTLIPGLIMLHEHLFYGKPYKGHYKLVAMPYTFPKMYLAGGVTTIRTAAAIEANTDINIKNQIDKGELIGPNIDVTSPLIERKNKILQLQTLYKNDNIEDWLNYWFLKGVTSVKAYNHITKEDLNKIIKFSHDKGFKVTGHLCSITYREAAEMGIDNLEHGFRPATDFVKNKPEDQCVDGLNTLSMHDANDPEMLELMNFLIEKNVTLTYTPTDREPFTGREVVLGGAEVSLAPYLMEQMQEIYDTRANTKRDSIVNVFFKTEMARIKKFYALGGKITVGTDPTGSGRVIAGYANQRVLELLLEADFTTEEAVKIASFNGAYYLNISDKTGTIEIGKNADLVLIDGDLTQDISNIRNVETVFKSGIGFDSKKIFDSVKGQVGLD